MKVLTGIDLVHLPTFNKSLNRGGEAFTKRIFLPAEITTDTLHMAGIFAAKEATFKALNEFYDLSWLNIEIISKINIKPKLKLHCPNVNKFLYNIDLSITHEIDYAIASVVALIK